MHPHSFRVFKKKFFLHNLQVVKYWKAKGQSGFFVWRYLLRRDDPEPAPWNKVAILIPYLLYCSYQCFFLNAKIYYYLNLNLVQKKIKKSNNNNAVVSRTFFLQITRVAGAALFG